MPSPTQITAPKLARLVGTPDCPALIDVCIDADHDKDPYLIPGSIRHPHTGIETLAPRLQGRRAVVICQKGQKLSQGCAAWLRHHGVAAEALEGGMIGWRDAGLPRIPVSAIPARDAQGRTVWVTRHRPKIDRIACPWLIRRFMDPAAVFLFVAPSEVEGVAERFGATRFDVDGAAFSHRGERCSFDAMVEDFGLSTEPLERLAAIVRGADTARLNLAPQSAGLLAASLGLSRMFRDDLAQLDAGMTLYDALYRWCRDAVTETHDREASL